MAAAEVTKKIIENYLGYFANKDKSGKALKPLLNEQLHFKSPLGEFFNAESFVNDVKKDVLAISDIQVRQIIVDSTGTKASALYDLTSKDPQIGSLMFSEWFEISDGKITAITSTYDASDIKKSMIEI